MLRLRSFSLVPVAPTAPLSVAPMPRIDADERRPVTQGTIDPAVGIDHDTVALVLGGCQRHHPEGLVAGQGQGDAHGPRAVGELTGGERLDLRRVDRLG